jgi:hypothetical protein
MAVVPNYPKANVRRAIVEENVAPQLLHAPLAPSDPPPKAKKEEQPPVIIHGSGWKVNIPFALIVVILTTLANIFAARAAPSPQDARLDSISAKAEEAREDTKKELSALHDELRDMRTEISVIKIELQYLRQKQDKP